MFNNAVIVMLFHYVTHDKISILLLHESSSFCRLKMRIFAHEKIKMSQFTSTVH